MPILALVAVVAIALFGLVALVPVSLVLRYRGGTARRRARDWVAAVNLLAITFSVVLFLASAALTSLWAPDAFLYALWGLLGGGLLGLVGLASSRWESAGDSLHYTPNRWLVLGITLVVSARVLYGLWRGWHVWRSGVGDTSWLAAFGVAGSLAAAAVVLGYYAAYWTGLWIRLRRHRRRVTNP